MSNSNPAPRRLALLLRPLRRRGASLRGRGPSIRAVIASLCAGGVATLGAALATPVGPASGSTLGGVATIASPGTTTALASGGSATPFTVSLPPQAACDGDTAHNGYHVYSYLVPQGTALSGVTFESIPTKGYGLVDSSGAYYGPINTAEGTGQIVSIPNTFEWAPLVTHDGVALSKLLPVGSGASAIGVWNAGLVCANSSGAVADNWNTEVTFTASASDPNGFTWSAFQISTPSLPAATPGLPYGPTALAAIGANPGSTVKWKKTAPLPKGLKLTGGGLLEGVPSAKKLVPGTNATVSVQVTETVLSFSGKTKFKSKITVSKSLTVHIA